MSGKFLSFKLCVLRCSFRRSIISFVLPAPVVRRTVTRGAAQWKVSVLPWPLKRRYRLVAPENRSQPLLGCSSVAVWSRWTTGTGASRSSDYHVLRGSYGAQEKGKVPCSGAIRSALPREF